ncbi:hypothetical protein QQZ08_005905 [Neonectria magnoliae]|uniref:F-box domain-containing protein n=1 Tax=Neonectria magnoliae TaxID=2732573 RepID=A0ABR1I299_9HYPO
MASLTSLPPEILVSLPEYLHNIEDYTSLSSSCRTLSSALASALPNTILRLAAAQSREVFGPSPYFLVAATARQLGDWARLSSSNEGALMAACRSGLDGLLSLALEHCGITLPRIRELYEMRFSILNPVTDIIDQCVGDQWYKAANFWDGGVDDAYTIDADPCSTLFHLAIYGELFGPDLTTYLDRPHASSPQRSLTVDTRLEFVKYCIPDFACELRGRMNSGGSRMAGLDPRRNVEPVGPYATSPGGHYQTPLKDNNVALVWVLKSTRWRPHWKRLREKAGSEFQDGFEEPWWYDAEDGGDWRQRLWENIMVCQGLDGLGMIRPKLQEAWLDRVRGWRAKIAALEKEPARIMVRKQATYDYPFLMGDLRVCASGYVGGT